MASTRALYIVPPRHLHEGTELDTVEKLREAVEAVGRALIFQGTEPFEGGEKRWYAWRTSPTFNGFSKEELPWVMSTCLRLESIFLGYTYAIWVINHVHSKLQNTDSSGEEPEFQTDDLREWLQKLYLAYLVLVDQVKGNLLLWNQRMQPYPCAEYFTHTCNVLINICAALHTIVFVEYGKRAGVKLSDSTWARLFLFVALRFERAYFLLTDFVWVMYGGSHISAVNLQRVCVGYVLYYRAKTYIISLRALGDLHANRSQSLRGSKYSESEIALAMAQRAIYLLRPLVNNPFFGFQERANQLLAYAEKIVRERVLCFERSSVVCNRIKSAKDYDKLDKIIKSYITDDQARHMLLVRSQTKDRLYYVPDETYGNYDAFAYHAFPMPE